MSSDMLLEIETTNHVIGAFDVYNTLGFGFLESIYAQALEYELLARSRAVQKEVMIPIWYKGRQLSSQRVDIIIDECVLLELKSTHVLPPTAERQLLNYLCATSLQVGLLLHFGPQARFYRKVHSSKLHAAVDPRNSR
jgi:GxxExxY protein